MFSSFLNLLLLITCVRADFGRLLLIDNPPPLDVGMGMSVSLTNRHLVIHQKARNGDLCRVEVDDNEPLSLMVGQLEPKKFNCFFKDNEVMYHHEGSPLARQDRIKLTVYYFWRNNSLVETAFVNVKIDVNPDYKVFEPLTDLNVKTSKAITSPISSDILRFRYDPSEERCTVSYASLRARGRRGDRGPWMSTRKWPAIGRVVDYRKRVVTGFEHDCQEMLLMGYRYEHRKPGSPDVDFIPLTVRVQKKTVGPPFPETRESLFLKVMIRNAAPNIPPKLKVRKVTLTNIGGTMEPLPNDAITIEKDESRKRFLILNVTSFRGTVPAQLVNKRDSSKAITSFTYDDFKEGKIYFQISDYKADRMKEYFIGLRAIDGYLAKSEEKILFIRNSLMKNQPFQFFNIPIITFSQASTLVKRHNFQVLGPNQGRIMQRLRYSISSSVTGEGPMNGDITVRGLPLTTFTPTDINALAVVYRHRIYGAESDALPVRANFMDQSARLRVPIHIVKLHDRRQVLKPSVSRLVDSKGYLCFGTDVVNRISGQFLLRDNVNLIFDVITFPSQGFLVRCVGKPPMNAPVKLIKSFTFQDLVLRRICYRHTGWSKDQFSVVQRRVTSRARLPPVTISITAQKAPVSALRMDMDPNVILQVAENANSAQVSGLFLRYSAPDVTPDNVRYIISMFPRFVDANTTVDAGRLINVKDLVRTGHTGDMQITSVVKDLKAAQIGTVTEFTQRHVDSGDIVYVPPLNDIGVSDRIVMLKFNVVTNLGHRLLDQKLIVRVKAQDDKAPQVNLRKINVKRGGVYTFEGDDFRIQDIDTPLRKIMVEVTKLPAHGELKDVKGRTMITGYRFPATAITRKKIKYVNNGKNFKSDTFNITVSDGPRTSNVSTVRLNITNYDWDEGAWKAYVNNSIQVRENSSVVIREAVFPIPGAKEGVKSDQDILYYVYENPVKGVIMRGNGVVSQFTLQDVRRNLIRYNHTSGEIGALTVYDFARVSMHLQGEPKGYRKINFSIIPENSQAPTVYVTSSLIVLEGRKDPNSIVGYNILVAVDRDTEERNIRIRVINKPLWGQIMVDSREAYDFTMAQIREGRVTYVQSKSSNGVEETRDQFSVTASDGKFLSKNCFVNVTIIPVNDEIPRLVLKDFTVNRGGKQPLNNAIFIVSDADVPQDNLQIRISRLPRHGDLMMYWKGGDKQKVTRLRNLFSRHYLAIMHLVYEQRNSSRAFKDSFEVTVSDGVHRVKKTCNIRITGENRLPPAMLSSQPLAIESDVMGVITKKQLNTIDADTPASALTYTLVKPPVHGQLVRARDNLNFLPRSGAGGGNESTATSGFTAKMPIYKGKKFNQDDVNRGKIAYMYLGKPRERVDDFWEVTVSDGKVTLPPRKIIVVCSNPPQTAPLSMKANVIRVNRDGAVTLTPNDIRIENSVTPVDRLKIKVAQMAKCGLLIDIKADTRVSLTSFLYNELHDQRIVFSVKDCPRETRELTMTLVVNDMSSRAETLLRIIIQSQPPVVKRFLPLTLKQNAMAVIGPDLVSTEDPDTPPNQISYRLVGPPMFGIVMRDGREILQGESFTQAEINQKIISYKSLKRSTTGEDMIRVTVSDGDHNTYTFAGRPARKGPIDLPIVIKPVARKLVLVINRSPTKLESFAKLGYGFRLSEDNLKSNYPKMTRFVVTRNPSYGRLSFQNNPSVNVLSFTDQDLSKGTLLYTLKSRGSKIATNDSFDIMLEVKKVPNMKEQYANNSKVYRMVLEWSKVQFRKKRYRVCERAGILKVRIQRFGFVKTKAYARVSVQTRGARIPRDFLPSAKTHIEFNEGETEKVYRITLKDATGRRDRKSNNKKRKRFLVMLKSTTNTLRGEISKAIVVIKEGKRCRMDPDFITPQENEAELKAEKMKIKKSSGGMRAVDGGNMLQDIRIPSDDELRRETLKREHLLIPDLPSSEELRKYEHHKVSFENLDQVPDDPPCVLMKIGMTIVYKKKTFICDGLQEKWIPIEHVDKAMPVCEKDWTLNNGRCYRYFDAPMIWTGAKASCEVHKAMLAAPGTMEKQKWITEKIARKRKFWIGLHYDIRKGLWQYTDSSSPNFSRWNRKRPSQRKLRRKRGARRCVMVSPVFTWCPRRCSNSMHQFGFVCEKPAT